MKLSLKGAVRFLAKAGRPILSILGVKHGTVAGKVVEGAEVLDPFVNPPQPEQKPKTSP